MIWEKLETAAEIIRIKYPYIRHGQALMNALYKLDRVLYLEISGTPNDPFYVDKKIPKFKELIKKANNEKSI